MAPIKFVASQARSFNQYKNIRTKVLKCCANIYCNRQFLIKKIVPNYANIKVPHYSPATLVTQKKIHFIQIKDEIKFLYKKKQKLNNDLYKIHLKAAQEWCSVWHTILESIINVTNQELEKKCRSIGMNLKNLDKSQFQSTSSELQKQFYLRVVNKTNITFSNEELPLLNKGLKCNLGYKHRHWIEKLALEAESAASYLPSAEQDYIRHQISHNIKHLYKQYKASHECNTIRTTKKETPLT